MDIKGSARDFTLDAVTLTLSALIVKVIGVIYKVPLSYMLSDEGMGYFNSAYTIFASFYVICAAGVPKAVSMLICEARARGNFVLCDRILQRTRYIFFIIGSFFTLLLLFLAGPLSKLVGNSGAFASVVSVSFSLVFISVSGVMRGYLNGMGKQMPIALCELIEAVFKLLFGLALAKISIMSGHSLQLTAALAVSGISLGAAASSLFLYMYIGRKRASNIDVCDVKYGIFRRVVKISLPIALSSFLMSVTNLIDLSFTMRRLVDIGYTPEGASALYGNYSTLAVPFLGLCISLVSPISVAALPKISSAVVKSDINEFRHSLCNAISLAAFIGAALTFGCMYFSEECLSLIFSDESAKIAAPYLSYLSPSFILAGILICVNTALEATGKTVAPLISMGIGAVIKIAVSYVLTGNQNIGIGGAAIGTVLFYATALFTSLVMLFCKTGVGCRIFIPIIGSGVSAMCAALCAKFIQELTNGVLFGTVKTLFIGCVYAILYLILSRLTVFKRKNGRNSCDFAQKEKKLLLKHT